MYVSGLNKWVDAGTVHSDWTAGLSYGVCLAMCLAMKSILGMFYCKVTKKPPLYITILYLLL